MIQRIERVSLVDEAYKRIKGIILSEDISEGTKIPSENALSDSLNVSRVVVREALTRLRSEKIIVTYQGKGSFKANPSNFSNSEKLQKTIDFYDFKNVVEFRSAIECAAVNAAIKEASDTELSELMVLAGEMEKRENDFTAFNAADYEFHAHIIKCSHNGLFLRAFNNCSEDIIATLAAMNNLSDSKEFALKVHREMADAIIKRDLKGVINIMRRNSEYNLARMSELLKQ